MHRDAADGGLSVKPYLPYNILLVLTLMVSGFLVLYNTVGSQRSATVLHYQYPVVEQSEHQSTPAAEEQRILPEWEETGPEPQPAEDQGQSTITSVRFPLDINTATVEQLKFIPQVGEVLAQRIVQYRDQLGGAYTSLEQLRDIKNVGDKTFERLCTYLDIAEELEDDDAPQDGSESQ